MATYETIKHVGYNLRNSDLKSITSQQLFEILRKATNTQTNSTLRHYAKILKQENFIKFNNEGRWDIIRD